TWVEDPGAPEPIGTDAAVVLLTAGWWAWSLEQPQPGPRWRGALCPDRSALVRGVVACTGKVARLRRDLDGRIRPASHPLSRIVLRLRDDAEDVAEVVKVAARLLRPVDDRR